MAFQPANMDIHLDLSTAITNKSPRRNSFSAQKQSDILGRKHPSGKSVRFSFLPDKAPLSPLP